METSAVLPPPVRLEAAEGGSIGAGDPRPHAVVIGSGFGGLAAAVRLGARGYRVTVLEKRDAPGGRAYVYRQDGFTFDAGPTIITLPFLFEELWALCGKRLSDHVRLIEPDPYYRLRFPDGSHFDCSGDAQRMRAEVARLSPRDAEGYDEFLRISEQIYEFAFGELGQIPFTDFTPMLKAGPTFAWHRADRSVFDFAKAKFRDPRLQIAFSFHPLFIGGNPLDATRLYALVSYIEHKWGVHCAIGGTGALVRGLCDLIAGQGGRVVYNCPVAEILIAEGSVRGVRLESGETLRADIVVSNADAPYTYKHLIAPERRKRWTNARLDRARYSMSLVVWYFGTKRRYEDVKHHTIVLGPRYEGLLRDIFHNKRLAEDFSLYLHRPTATDPSLAPPGCDAFYVLSPVPHLDAGVDWETSAEPYRAAIQQRLEETVLPGLGAEIVSSRLIAPPHFRDELNSLKGSAFSLEPVIFQSAWFRPHNVSEEAKGLFLVGAGTHPGAGVPGVLSSARILDQVVPHAADIIAARR
jgi:phytoene desaturase